MSELSQFFAFVESQRGSPPVLSSWAALAAALRMVPDADLLSKFKEVEATFELRTDTTDYDSWNEAKRRRANADAALALREAMSRGFGNASIEQQRRMMAYTGFGGMRDVGVLPAVFPEEYVRASEEWAKAKQLGTMVPSASATIMERVRDQYFTSMDLTKAAWTLLNRTNPDPAVILEPSAGIGRYVRTGPVGREWRLVELDEMMGNMLRMLFPEARVYPSWFEEYARANPPKVDVVVGNPPYGKRPPEALARDMRDIAQAVDYFTLRGANELVAGGTLCYLVPVSFMTSSRSVDARTRMLRGCAFRGAAILPSGAFPLVREGTFVHMLWTRRDKIKKESQFDEREKAIASGDYLELDEAVRATCGGEWRTSSRGNLYLHGDPDLSHVGELWLAPAPVEPASTPLTRTEPKAPAKKEVEAADDAAESSVAKQVQRFVSLLIRDPREAERERAAVRQAVVEYIGDNGNPHPKGPAALRAVVSKDGTLEPVLTNPVAVGVNVEGIPPDGASFTELVSWWSERRGHASPDDLEMSAPQTLRRATADSSCPLPSKPSAMRVRRASISFLGVTYVPCLPPSTPPPYLRPMTPASLRLR